MRPRRSVIVVLLILVIPLIPVLAEWNQDAGMTRSAQLETVEKRFTISYVEHNRIDITGNLDFESQAGASGWTGNGSESNPYRIQNLNITNSSVCISITDVTVHFVISNSLIYCTDTFGSAIELNNASNGVVEDSIVYQGRFGIKVFRSHGFWIENNSVVNCGSSGIDIQQSNWTSIIGNNVFQTGFDSSSGGIYVNASYHGRIFDNEAHGNDFAGIRVQLSEDWNITFNDLHDNENMGIYGFDSENVNVSFNDIYDNDINNDAGIELRDSSDWTITDNWLSNNHRDGIFLNNCTSINIEENEIHNSDSRSLRVYETKDCNITSNLMLGATFGVSISYSNNTRVIDNIVSDFRFEGISLFRTNNSWVYMNDVAFNEVGSLCREDEGIGNFWDDNISVGNWYGDYDGGENYSIWFQANIDRYPQISINASYAAPLEYEVGTTGHVMNWTQAYALHPTHFQVHVEGVLLENQTWDGSHIEVNVDGLVFGNHSVSLTIYHVSGNSVSSVSYVNVVDTTPPTWDQLPTGQLYELGESFSYDLNASDIGGITSFWLNDTTYFDFGIGVGGVLENTSFVPAGVYDLEVRVYDVGGNYASANITINVIDTVAPTWDQTPASQAFEFGTAFAYQVSAGDLAGIHHYWLNDTTYFNVSLSGLISNSSQVPVGIYTLEVRAYDPSDLFCSAVINITVSDTTPPTWIITPEDQVLTHGESFSYQLIATDLSGISSWHVIDSEQFRIDDGLITSLGSLQPGVYTLYVTVLDIYGNTLFLVLTVAVLEMSPTSTTTTTTTNPGPTPPPPPNGDLLLIVPMVAGIVVVIIFLVYIRSRIHTNRVKPE
ncbi:MAG: right-handed parallel beta-helix repeat-containing protein [Candidatus Thorarchaeota archaeon]|jgi:parallel beta-helix repeat protein